MPNDLDTALKQIRGNLEGYNHYADYHSGAHNLSFATSKYANAFGSLFREFADNLCPGVVDAVADRLQPTGFGVEEGDASISEQAWKIWQANRMDQRSGEAHQTALKLADCYVIVWPNAGGEPTFYINDPRNMTIVYDEDEPGKVLWAAKAWVTQDKFKRLTLYYPDRIEKYISARAGSDTSLPYLSQHLQEYHVEGEAWPLANPYGRVPVFHLANNAGVGKFGTSELKHVIPLQDALNKSVSDMLVAMEFVAYPQRWATGIQIPVDPTTKQAVQPFNPAIDRFWATPDKEAAFGQLPAADLTNFLSVSDSFRMEIARVSATPLHFFMLITNPPSGEALKTLEARFTKKVKDRQASYGNAWEDAMKFALLVAGVSADIRLTLEWEDAAPVSTKEKYDTADIALNRLSLDEEYVWATLLDIPQAEIDAMLKRKEERKAQEAKDAEAMMQTRAKTFGTQPAAGPQNGAQPATGQAVGVPMNGKVAA